MDHTINPWFKDQEEYEQHREMIDNPSRWPMSALPVLCLKNPGRIQRNDVDQFARIMVADEGGYWFWIAGAPAEDRSKEPWSTDKLLENGWVVD